jgi:hypothetical protein
MASVAWRTTRWTLCTALSMMGSDADASTSILFRQTAIVRPLSPSSPSDVGGIRRAGVRGGGGGSAAYGKLFGGGQRVTTFVICKYMPFVHQSYGWTSPQHSRRRNGKCEPGADGDALPFWKQAGWRFSFYASVGNRLASQQTTVSKTRSRTVVGNLSKYS